MLNLESIEKQILHDEKICPNIIKLLIKEIKELRKEVERKEEALSAAYMSGRYDGRKGI